MDLLAAFRELADVVIDAWVITDAEGQIREFNRAFYALFQRSVARRLKGLALGEALRSAEDPVALCLEQGRQVRLDEIQVTVAESAEELRVIYSALPLRAERWAGDETSAEPPPVEAILVIIRNVTDEASIQQKYQEMLETEAAQRERLQTQLQERTQALVETNQELLEVRRELIAHQQKVNY